MISISEFYEKAQFFIAVTVGSILQILFTTNLNARLVLTILISSLFVGLYIMYPVACLISSKFNLDKTISTHLTNSLLSISGFTSLFFVKLILNITKNNKWISTAIKAKIAKTIGIDPKILIKKDDNANRE